MIYLFEVQESLKDLIEDILATASQTYSVSLTRAPVLTDSFPEELVVPETLMKLEDISVRPYFLRCKGELRLYLAVELGEDRIIDLLNFIESHLRAELEQKHDTLHTNYFGSISRVSRKFSKEENVIIGSFEFEVNGIEHIE